jgi:hypothetical protein
MPPTTGLSCSVKIVCGLFLGPTRELSSFHQNLSSVILVVATTTHDFAWTIFFFFSLFALLNLIFLVIKGAPSAIRKITEPSCTDWSHDRARRRGTCLLAPSRMHGEVVLASWGLEVPHRSATRSAVRHNRTRHKERRSKILLYLGALIHVRLLDSLARLSSQPAGRINNGSLAAAGNQSKKEASARTTSFFYRSATRLDRLRLAPLHFFFLSFSFFLFFNRVPSFSSLVCRFPNKKNYCTHIDQLAAYTYVQTWYSLISLFQMDVNLRPLDGDALNPFPTPFPYHSSHSKPSQNIYSSIHPS